MQRGSILSYVRCNHAKFNLDTGKFEGVMVNISSRQERRKLWRSMLKGAGGSLIAVAALVLLPLRRARFLMVVALVAMLGSVTLVTGCGGKARGPSNQHSRSRLHRAVSPTEGGTVIVAMWAASTDMLKALPAQSSAAESVRTAI
jgi:hypothetical protein